METRVKVVLVYAAPDNHVSGGQYETINLDSIDIIDAVRYIPGYPYRGASGAQFLSEREADCFLMTTIEL